MEMRAVLGAVLAQIMAEDDRVVVVDADLAKANGTMALRKTFPDRAFDVGIAEQNMVSVAAGLASYGYIPFVTSFAPFASRRVCDQIAISVCYARQNVKIIGTDPGIAGELNGGTHMSMEDVGALRSIPGLVIVDVSDTTQLDQALRAIKDYDGPVYLRMYRKTLPDIFDPSYQFDLFKADVLRQGQDITLFTSGIPVKETLDAAELLSRQGIQAEVIQVHTIKPIDRETVLQSVRKTGCAVTAENHNVIGGLYSAVCETLAASFPCPVLPVGIQDTFGIVGRLPYLKERFELTAESIVKQSLEAKKLKR